jgi:hypothetical protein
MEATPNDPPCPSPAGRPDRPRAIVALVRRHARLHQARHRIGLLAADHGLRHRWLLLAATVAVLMIVRPALLLVLAGLIVGAYILGRRYRPAPRPRRLHPTIRASRSISAECAGGDCILCEMHGCHDPARNQAHPGGTEVPF